MGIRRGKAQHHFRQGARNRIPLQLSRKTDVKAPQIEAHQEVELSVFLQDKLRLTFAQQLQRRAVLALGPQRAFGDDALHAVLPGRQPDDLGGLAVAERGKHDGGCGHEGHGGNVAGGTHQGRLHERLVGR
jgi:hypothetical protein